MISGGNSVTITKVYKEESGQDTEPVLFFLE